MLAYFGERISPHMTDTPEGFLICHDVPIGRTGEMEYLARELQLDGDPERVVRVTREETEVFSPVALASFEGKPVTDGHPPENVSPENFASYTKGHVQNVRRAGEMMVADLHIMDPGLVNDVKNSVKREVSCGYTCTYESSGDGFCQRDIRGNHVAVVPKGRAGHEVAIKDEARSTQEKLGPVAEGAKRDNKQKGRKRMKKETKEAMLRFFGLAAQDAEPEELEQMSKDAATLLEEGAKPEQDALPVEKPAAPAGNPLEAKLDKLIELMSAAFAAKAPPAESPEETLDKAISEGGSAAVVEENTTPGKETADAAVRLLKSVRPIIASMKDPAEKRAVTDALLESIRGSAEDPGAKLLAATAAAAKQATQDSDPVDHIRAQQSAYDARNPHKKQKEGN